MTSDSSGSSVRRLIGRLSGWRYAPLLLLLISLIPASSVAMRFSADGQLRPSTLEAVADCLHTLRLIAIVWIAWRLGRRHITRLLAPSIPERDLEQVGAWFLLSRLAVLALALAGSYTFVPPDYNAKDLSQITLPGRLTECVIQWDSIFYLQIAEGGYPRIADLTFFPGYPLATRALSVVVGGDIDVAAIAISHIAFFASALLLYSLGRSLGGRTLGRNVASLFCASPLSFYFSSALSESMYLALVLGAFTLAMGDRFRWAALLGAIAAFTRPVGVVLVVQLGWIYLWKRNFELRRLDRDALPIVAVLAGTALHMGICQLISGDPLAFLHEQSKWRPEIIAPFADLLTGRVFRVRGGIHQVGATLEALATIVALACLAYGVIRRRQIPSPYLVFLAAQFIISFSGGSRCVARFLSVSFPVYIYLALPFQGRRGFGHLRGAALLGLGFLSGAWGAGYFVE